MFKILSDLIENTGTTISSLVNRRSTNQGTFRGINDFTASEIESLYSNNLLFTTCHEISNIESLSCSIYGNAKVESFKTKSMYKPLSIYKKIYDKFKRNHNIYYDLIQHNNTSSTDIAVVYVHGFSMRNYSREYSIFKKIVKMYNNISLYPIQIPFHMKRSPKLQPYSGAYFFDSCPVVSIEALRQAVNDVSQLISIVKSKHKKIIVGGFSLGGYITSLLATCDNRADLYLIGQADADLPTCMDNSPVCPGLHKNKIRWTKNRFKFQEFYKPINLLNHNPVVKDNKVISIAGRYDKLINFDSVLTLRKFFNSKYNIDYNAGHLGFMLEAKGVINKLLKAIEQEIPIT